MAHDWGSVDGDINADAIISDRRQERRWAIWPQFLLMAAFIGSCFWLGTAGGNAAIATTIFLASAWLAGVVRSAIFTTHTMVLITERRVQLAEQGLQEIRLELSRRPR